ncbi:hypothetical protein CCMA1212_002416, partial [Trichoderma ghanense]
PPGELILLQCALRLVRTRLSHHFFHIQQFRAEQMAPTMPPKAPTATPSINQLLRLHCRERLVLHPVEWTHRHLELLECSFEQPIPEPASGYLYAQVPTEKQLQDNLDARYVRQLASRRGRGAGDFAWREAQLGRILASDEHFSIHYRAGIYFHFDDRSCNLPCILVGDCTGQRSNIPFAACIDRFDIENQRYDRVKAYRGVRQSEATSSLRSLQLRRLTPSNYCNDPYILALMIALAQGQRAALESNNGAERGFRPQVLMTSYKEKHIHLFTAEISSAFLKRLDVPCSTPLAQEPVLIQHILVSLKPYATFRRRIFQLLLRENIREAAHLDGDA